MGIGGNPKKMAQDISEGLITFNSANLRRYAAPDLKVIVDHLNACQAGLRQETIAMDDEKYQEKTKDKNRRLSRIRNAMTVLRTFCHRRSIKGVF